MRKTIKNIELINYLVQYENSTYSEIINKIHNEYSSLRFNDISQIKNVSKKTLIINDSTFFTETSNKSKKCYLKTIERTDYHNSGMEDYDVDIYLKTTNIVKLRSWFKNAKPFIDNKTFYYLPELHKECKFEDGVVTTFDIRVANEIKRKVESSACIKALPDGQIWTNDSDLVPLLNLNLPYIENVEFETLYKIMNDYPDRLLRLRNYLLKKIIDIPSPIETNNFQKEIRKIELDIKDKIHETTDQYESIKKLHFFNILGATIIPWSIMLFAFFISPDGIMKIIGPGGVIASLSVAISNYLREKLSLDKNPINFLMIIGKSRK